MIYMHNFKMASKIASIFTKFYLFQHRIRV